MIFLPDNLRNAMKLPVNVNMPIRTVAGVAMASTRLSAANEAPSVALRSNSAVATSAEAAPPNPFRAATSSGIWVVGVLRAR